MEDEASFIISYAEEKQRREKYRMNYSLSLCLANLPVSGQQDFKGELPIFIFEFCIQGRGDNFPNIARLTGLSCDNFHILKIRFY